MIKVLGNKSYGNQINTLASRGNTSISVSKINASGSTSGGYSKPGVESIDLSAKRQQEKINAAHQSVIDKFKQLKSQAESRMFGSKTGKFNVTSSNLSRNVSDGSKSGILSGMSAGVSAVSSGKKTGTTFYTTRGNGITSSASINTKNERDLQNTHVKDTVYGHNFANTDSREGSARVNYMHRSGTYHPFGKVETAKSFNDGGTFGNISIGNIPAGSKLNSISNIGNAPVYSNMTSSPAIGNAVNVNQSAFSNGIGNAARVNSDNLDYAVAKVHVDPTTGRVTPATAGNASGAVLEAASAGVHNESFTSYGNRALGYEKYSAKEVVFNEDARKFTSSGNGALGYQGFSSTNPIGEGAAAGAATGVNGVNSVLGNGSLGSSFNPLKDGAAAGTATGVNSANSVLGNGSLGSSFNPLKDGAAAGTATGVNSANSVLGNGSLGASYNPTGVVGNAALGAGLNNSTEVPATGNAALGQGYGYDQPIPEDPSVTPENPETPVVDPETPGVDPGTPETPVVDPETPGVDPGTPETPVVDSETPGVDPGTPETPVVNPETPGVDPTTPSGNVPNGETPSANIPISGGTGGAGGAGGAGGSVTVNVPTGTTTTGTTPTTTATAGTVTDSYNTNVSNSGNTYYNYSNNIQGNNFGTQSGGTTVNNYYNGGQGQSAPVSPAGFVNPQVQTPSISVGGGSSTPASTGTTTATTAGTNTSTVGSATPVETVSTPVTDASNNASVSAFINKEGIAASATPTSGWGSMTGLGVAGGAAVATAGVMAMPSNIKTEEVEEKLNKEDQKNEQFRQAISQQFGQVNNISTDQAGIETINANPGSSSIN